MAMAAFLSQASLTDFDAPLLEANEAGGLTLLDILVTLLQVSDGKVLLVHHLYKSLTF